MKGVSEAARPRNRLADGNSRTGQPENAPKLCGFIGIRVRAFAPRIEAALTEETFPAGDRERHDDAIADLKLVVGPDLDNLAHSFMSENVAMLHRRYHAVEYMEVRTADRAGSHLDDRILVMLDFRIRYAFAADIVLAVLGERLHSVLHPFGNTND